MQGRWHPGVSNPSGRGRHSFLVPGEFPTWRKRDGVLGTGIAWAEHGGQYWVRAPTREELWILAVPGYKCRAWFHCPWGNCTCVLAFTDPSALFWVWRNSRRDVYQLPLAANVEKMKTTHPKQPKAFALIREILGRQPRLPMRNLPTWLVLNTDLKRNCITSDEPHTACWTFSQDISSSSFCPILTFFQWPFRSNSPLWLHPQQVTSFGPLCPELQWHRILQLLGHHAHSWPQAFAQAVPSSLSSLTFLLTKFSYSFILSPRLLYLQTGFLWPKALNIHKACIYLRLCSPQADLGTYSWFGRWSQGTLVGKGKVQRDRRKPMESGVMSGFHVDNWGSVLLGPQWEHVVHTSKLSPTGSLVKAAPEENMDLAALPSHWLTMILAKAAGRLVQEQEHMQNEEFWECVGKSPEKASQEEVSIIQIPRPWPRDSDSVRLLIAHMILISGILN